MRVLVLDMVITLRKGYSPKICVYPAENPEFFELRWNLVGCILGCEFCKTPASKPEKLGNQIIELNPTQIFNMSTQNIEIDLPEPGQRAK